VDTCAKFKDWPYYIMSLGRDRASACRPLVDGGTGQEKGHQSGIIFDSPSSEMINITLALNGQERPINHPTHLCGMMNTSIRKRPSNWFRDPSNPSVVHTEQDAYFRYGRSHRDAITGAHGSSSADSFDLIRSHISMTSTPSSALGST
jgi:hypothetical protein